MCKLFVILIEYLVTWRLSLAGGVGGGGSSIRWVGGLSFAGSVLLGFLLFFRGGVTSPSPQSGRICLGS